MFVGLSVKNYALIEALQLAPSPKLSVITGETGAGKSILLGALNLLLGQRNYGKILWHDNKKCVIEGVFNIAAYDLETLFREEDLDYTEETLLRREITPTGKSRAFVNDTPVSLEVLRQISHRLIDIHSQDETTLISNSQFQRESLDHWANNTEALRQYKSALTAYKEAKKAYEALQEATTLGNRDEAYHMHLLKELEEAQIVADEEKVLEAKLHRLTNRQNLAEKQQISLELLSTHTPSILSQLTLLVQNLEDWSSHEQHIAEFSKRAESARIELKDIADSLEKETIQEESSEESTEEVQRRLYEIYALQKKHKVSGSQELLEVQEQLSHALANLNKQQEHLEIHRKQVKEAEESCRQAAEVLSKRRIAALEPFSQAVTSHLAGLGMPEGQFFVKHTPCALQQEGIDVLDFFFSANKGISAKPLAQIASGGERSRLMFIIKYLQAAKRAMPTLIFDEIDTGISGETAKKMITMIQNMAHTHQILLISHLPQFAAKADKHFFIFKEVEGERTVSKIRELQLEERIEAIAQMLEGIRPSSHARESAKWLLTR